MIPAAAPRTLRDVLSSTSRPEEVVKHTVNHIKPYAPGLSTGRLVFDYAEIRIGKGAIRHIALGREKLRLPMCFWPGCCRLIFQMACTAAKRKSLSKALVLYIKGLRKLLEKTARASPVRSELGQRVYLNSNPGLNAGSTPLHTLCSRMHFWPRPGRDQTQAKGSYREEDMVELLEKTLPTASRPSETKIVCLDWFAAHGDPEIIELIQSRGHVLLLHGGGTTAYEQINDTHLHATFRARLRAQARRIVCWDQTPAWFNITAERRVHRSPPLKEREAATRRRFTTTTWVHRAASRHTDEHVRGVGVLFIAAPGGKASL